MIINNKKFDINDILDSNAINSGFSEPVNENLSLTKYQIELLQKNNIDYQRAGSLKEIIYMIQDVLEEDENEELELILEDISERDYYENTNK